MNLYGKLDDLGFIIYTIESNEVQPDCVLIDFDMGTPASAFDRYNYNQKKWLDTRTEEQKYNDSSIPVLLKRDKLLYASDWTQIPNNPLTVEQQQAWAVYRQELRDITTQSGYPFNVIWPTPPQG